MFFKHRKQHACVSAGHRLGAPNWTVLERMSAGGGACAPFECPAREDPTGGVPIGSALVAHISFISRRDVDGSPSAVPVVSRRTLLRLRSDGPLAASLLYLVLGSVRIREASGTPRDSPDEHGTRHSRSRSRCEGRLWRNPPWSVRWAGGGPARVIVQLGSARPSRSRCWPATNCADPPSEGQPGPDRPAGAGPNRPSRTHDQAPILAV
jgi:hypothetical protein